MTDAGQNKVWDAYVEPFGQAQVFGTPSAGLDLRLPGQFTEAETGGLSQNWNRDYDPSLGRYIEADPLGIEAGQNVYGYVDGNPLSDDDPWGLYPAVVVFPPGGRPYFPLTTVKNSAQARAFGLPKGTRIAIAVPPNTSPQAQASHWSCTIFKGRIPFAWYWRPRGPHDYKRISPKYDAYANFEYGVTGRAAGYSLQELQFWADLLHSGWHNDPVNTADINSGYRMYSNGAMLGVEDYEPTRH